MFANIIMALIIKIVPAVIVVFLLIKILKATKQKNDRK